MEWMRKKKKQKTSYELCEGISFDSAALEEVENRKWTLFEKGFVVYLLIMGSMGCFVSAVSVDYNFLVVNGIILFSSLYCALLYFNKKWENIGYILLLVIMSFFGYRLRIYINSGFYAIFNDTAEQASAYFNTNAMRSFGEQVNNRYLAVTIAMAYVGSVFVIVLNVLISRHMQYIVAIPVLMGAQIVPMYFMLKPDLFYVVIFVAGMFLAFIIRGGGHFKLAKDDKKYTWQKKKRLSYQYDAKTLGGILGIVILLTVTLLFTMERLIPIKMVEKEDHNSALKESTMDIAENLSILGIAGLFNYYPNTGGLTSGRLGGVSAIKPDYNTDLKVRFTPYSADRVYLKSFVGANYLPGENKWSRDEKISSSQEGERQETEALKKRYDAGAKKSARGIMEVENVAAAIGRYLPYYSAQEDKITAPGDPASYTYYPVVDASIPYKVKEEDVSQWLSVPEENEKAIKIFCSEAGIGGSKEEVVKQVIAYYQAHIPYTTQPGATPYHTDFINYFLLKNRRGYCAHFASAATLIFRYFGIPARYVEGYAFDYEEMADGKVLRTKNVSDYFQGYKKLNAANVLEVDVTDANAHAWVEIYDKTRGWQVVEVTPSSGEDEEIDSGLWDMFMRMIGGNSSKSSHSTTTTSNTAGLKMDGSTKTVAGGAAGIVLLLIFTVTAMQFIVKWIRRKVEFRQMSVNDKLIAQYSFRIAKLMRKYPELKEKRNYQEQIDYLCQCKVFDIQNQDAKDRCVRILGQAGFSPVMISQEEYDYVLTNLQASNGKNKKT